jgi:hypothetical protein
MPTGTQVKAFLFMALVASARATNPSLNFQQTTTRLTTGNNPTADAVAQASKTVFSPINQVIENTILNKQITTPSALIRTDIHILLSEIPFPLQQRIEETNTHTHLVSFLYDLFNRLNNNHEFTDSDIDYDRDPQITILRNKGLELPEIGAIIESIINGQQLDIDPRDLNFHRKTVLKRLTTNVCELPRSEAYPAVIETLENYYENVGVFFEHKPHWNKESQGAEKLLTSLRLTQDYTTFTQIIFNTLDSHAKSAAMTSQTKESPFTHLSQFKDKFTYVLDYFQHHTGPFLQPEIYANTIMTLLDVYQESLLDYILLFEAHGAKDLVKDVKTLRSIIKKLSINIFIHTYKACDNNKDNVKEVLQRDIHAYNEKIRNFYHSFEKLDLLFKQITEEQKAAKDSKKKEETPSPTSETMILSTEYKVGVGILISIMAISLTCICNKAKKVGLDVQRQAPVKTSPPVHPKPRDPTTSAAQTPSHQTFIYIPLEKKLENIQNEVHTLFEVSQNLTLREFRRKVSHLINNTHKSYLDDPDFNAYIRTTYTARWKYINQLCEGEILKSIRSSINSTVEANSKKTSELIHPLAIQELGKLEGMLTYFDCKLFNDYIRCKKLKFSEFIAQVILEQFTCIFKKSVDSILKNAGSTTVDKLSALVIKRMEKNHSTLLQLPLLEECLQKRNMNLNTFIQLLILKKY